MFQLSSRLWLSLFIAPFPCSFSLHWLSYSVCTLPFLSLRLCGLFFVIRWLLLQRKLDAWNAWHAVSTLWLFSFLSVNYLLSLSMRVEAVTLIRLLSANSSSLSLSTVPGTDTAKCAQTTTWLASQVYSTFLLCNFGLFLSTNARWRRLMAKQAFYVTRERGKRLHSLRSQARAILSPNSHTHSHFNQNVCLEKDNQLEGSVFLF